MDRLYAQKYLGTLLSLVLLALVFSAAWFAHMDPGPGRRNPLVFIAVLMLIATAVAVGAIPIVRRLTGRLQYLQLSLEALGEGRLSTRVEVEGRDEVSELAGSFNRSAAKIEALLTAHKTLLSNVSHELRSPLARIRMAVEIMGEQAQEEVKLELVRSMDELDQLIEEILLASRLDATADLSMGSEETDLTAILAEECAAIDAQLEAEPAIIPGDARLLRRMIRNLLDNAKRYGGGTDVCVQLAFKVGQVQVDVVDDGDGIPEAERDNIFTPFYRLSGAGENSGGVGLGLSLVRQIAEAHGGGVSYVSLRNRGSCFRVLLPAP
jgi:signal transduction histidine kinase